MCFGDLKHIQTIERNSHPANDGLNKICVGTYITPPVKKIKYQYLYNYNILILKKNQTFYSNNIFRFNNI